MSPCQTTPGIDEISACGSVFLRPAARLQHLRRKSRHDRPWCKTAGECHCVIPMARDAEALAFGERLEAALDDLRGRHHWHFLHGFFQPRVACGVEETGRHRTR